MILLLLLWSSSSALGQHVYGTSWKKRVTRIVDGNIPRIAMQTDDRVGYDLTFTQVLLANIIQGKIKALSPADYSTWAPLTNVQIEETFWPKLDSQINYKDELIVELREFNFSYATKLKIVEDWTFDPSLGIACITIAMVAPMRDVYGDDGVYRGSQSLFFVSYKDAVSALNNYTTHRTDSLFPAKIWRSYFKDTVELPERQSWQSSATKVITVHDEDEPQQPFLKWFTTDSTFTQYLATALVNDEICAFSASDTNLLELLTRADVDRVLAKRIDTAIITCAGGTEVESPYRIRIADFDLNVVPKLNLIEDWTFDPELGKTTIQARMIAPVEKVYPDYSTNSTLRPLFYVSYTDALRVLDRYFQYHPEDQFPLKIWQDFFQSDTKPTRLKK